MDARSAPGRILRSHSQDQVPQVTTDGRSPFPSTSREPSPILGKPVRCHWTTVSGFTKASVSDHLDHHRLRIIQKIRSAPPIRGRRPLWTRTARCCRSAKFSSRRSARRRNRDRTTPRSSRARRSMRFGSICRVSARSRILDRTSFGEGQEQLHAGALPAAAPRPP